MPSRTRARTAHPPSAPDTEAVVLLSEPAAGTATAAPVLPVRKAATKPRAKVAKPPEADAAAVPAAVAGTVETVKPSEAKPARKPAPARKAVSASKPAVARKRAPRKTPAPLLQADLPLSADKPGLPPAVSAEAASAATPEVPEGGTVPAWSELRLQHGEQGSELRWRPGTACPAPLQALVDALLDGDGCLDPRNDRGLLALHHEAGALGHELRVEPDVWRALARVRDVRARMHRLEQAYAEGEASPALRSELQRPGGRALAPFQLEGALFATCAGRSLLADEAGLGHVEQALGAARLLARHFGVQRVVVLCAESARPLWQRVLPAGCGEQTNPPAAAVSPQGAQHWLCSHAAWPAAGPLLRDWAPELVIVDDTTPWPDDDLAQQLSQWPAPYALWLSQADPAAQPDRVAGVLQWLDPLGIGARRQMLLRHRDAAAEAPAWTALDTLAQTLAPVSLRRTRAQCLQPLPGRDDALLWVPLAHAERERQAAALACLRPLLSRWQRMACVSDLEQCELRAALQALHEVCAATGEAKLQALRAHLPQWLAEPQRRVLLLTESAMQRDALAEALAMSGFSCGPQLSIEADGDAMLSDEGLPSRVVGVDLPWRSAALRRRAARAVQAPMQHLLAEDALDAWRLWAQAAQPSTSQVLSRGAEVVFLQDAVLTDWIQALCTVTSAADE